MGDPEGKAFLAEAADDDEDVMRVRHGVSFGCTKRWTSSGANVARPAKDASAWNGQVSANPFKKSFPNKTGRLRGGLFL
jgi:hypothetical protein